MNTAVSNRDPDNTELNTQQSSTKFSRKKILIILGLFLAAFGFVYMTEEILGCSSLKDDVFRKRHNPEAPGAPGHEGSFAGLLRA